MFIFTLNFNSSLTCICTLGFNYSDLKHFNKHYLHRFSEGKLAGRVGGFVGWFCWVSVCHSVFYFLVAFCLLKYIFSVKISKTKYDHFSVALTTS